MSRKRTVLPLDYYDYVKIYCLINPLNDQVFYVGATSQKLNERLCTHIINSRDCSNAKSRLINELSSKGIKPEMLMLEVVHILDASFNENFYMELFTSYGFDLLQTQKSNYTERHTYGRGYSRPLSNNNIYKTKQDAFAAVSDKVYSEEGESMVNAILRGAEVYELKNGSFVKCNRHDHKNYWIVNNFKSSEYELSHPYDRFGVMAKQTA